VNDFRKKMGSIRNREQGTGNKGENAIDIK